MKKMLLALIGVIALSGSAFAECSQADAQAKANEFTTKLQQLIQKDPSKMAKWQQKSQEMMQKSQDMKTPDEACAYLDSLIKEINADL